MVKCKRIFFLRIIPVSLVRSLLQFVPGVHIEARCMTHDTETMMIDRPFFYNIVKLIDNRETEDREVVSIFSGHICDPSVK